VDKKSPLDNNEIKSQFEIKRNPSEDFDMDNDPHDILLILFIK